LRWRTGRGRPSFCSNRLCARRNGFEPASGTVARRKGNLFGRISNALNNHALNLDRLRRGAEAEPFFIEALERKRAADGAQHPDVLVILHNYALMLEGLGRYSQAEPLFREELQLSFALNGPASSDALDSLSAYAVTLAKVVVRF